MTNRLADKIALVTGGTSGIGLATAKAFASEGAFVYVTGRRKAELDAAVSAIGARSIGIHADSTQAEDLARLFSTIAERDGRIDVLFVNAGGGSMVPLGSISEDHYLDTFDRNVKAVIFTVQGALPLLEASKTGASVVLTGSTAGTTGTASFSVYGASKAAVRSLARSWVVEFKGRSIRVNVVAPGPIRTPGLAELAGSDPAQQEGLINYLTSLIPLGRIGHADDVAKAVVFLASDEAAFVTGIELFVDGGIAQI